jgi:hypothetical protein
MMLEAQGIGQTPAPDAPVIVQSIPAPPWETLPPPVVMLIFFGMLAAGFAILYPLVRAIARRLEGRQADPGLRAEVDELRMRLHEMEGQQGRVAELEERLDFAERLLAQGQERARLGDQ